MDSLTYQIRKEIEFVKVGLEEIRNGVIGSKVTPVLKTQLRHKITKLLERLRTFCIVGKFSEPEIRILDLGDGHFDVSIGLDRRLSELIEDENILCDIKDKKTLSKLKELMSKREKEAVW